VSGEFSVRVHGLPWFTAHSTSVQEAIHRGAAAGGVAGASRVEALLATETSRKKKVNLGTLKKRWKTVVHADPMLVGRQSAHVTNDAPYAAVIERGRRPGGRMPPVKELIPWVKRKLRPGAQPPGAKRRKSKARRRAERAAKVIARRSRKVAKVTRRKARRMGAAASKKLRRLVGAAPARRPRLTPAEREARQREREDRKVAAAEARRARQEAARRKVAAKARAKAKQEALEKQVAFAVARKIQRKGTEGAWIVRDAAERAADLAVREMEREVLAEIQRVLGGGT